MAGHGPHLLHEDPALEKYNVLKTNLHNSYKFTKKAGFYAALFMVVIPGVGFYFSHKWEGKQGAVYWGAQRSKPVFAADWYPRK